MNTLISSLSNLGEFHFLRPEWLFALIPALIAFWWLYKRQKHAGNWENVIAPELLPLLLDRVPVKQRRSLPLIAMFGWILAALAMSGPTWERTPLPVHKQENALVVIFDLSPSMLAQDLKPNRLTRARLKLIDLLQQRQEGTTALVAYAGDSFIVSPLTDDADTVAALVPALDPNIMPSHGSNAEAAIQHAVELVFNAGLTEGNFLLVTDGVSASAQETINETISDLGGFRLSILGIGTEEGAPIPLGNGGFAKDKSGNIVVPRLDINSLKKLANLNGGRFSSLTADDQDIHYLTEQFSTKTSSSNKQLERTFDSWDDQGYWLVLPLLFILLLAFRRGLLASVLIAPMFPISLLFSASMLCAPQPAQAFGWEDLWSTKNQQAAKAMEQGDIATAQQQFKDPNWKAAAAYRNGDFETAKELYATDDISESTAQHYNYGNALAKSGKLEDAIKSYEQALSLNPDNEDARFNKVLVEKLLEQQQQQQQQQNNDESKQQDQSSDKQDQQNGDSQQQSEQKSETSEDDSSENNSSQNASNQSNPSDQDDSKDDQPNQNSNDEELANNQSENPQANTKDEAQPSPEPQQAQGEQQQGNTDKEGKASDKPASPTKEMTEEEKQAMEQWLRRIPDDPGGLLREKFRYESKKRTYERRRGITQPPSQNEERW